MKIRSGFVSNSSSSSFILEILGEGDTCSKCGRSDTDFVELMERYEGDGSCEETQVYHYDKESVLRETDGEIKCLIGKLKLLSKDDPNRVVYRSNWSGKEHVTLVSDEIIRYNDELDAECDLRRKIEPAVGRVVKCSISYHDKITNDLMSMMVKAGTMKILYGDED